MRLYIKIFFICILILTSTGCWDKEDLGNLAIIAGAAIDKLEDGKTELTVQIVKPEAMKPAGEMGGNEKSSYVNVSVYGETILDASRNLFSKINKVAYWAQTSLIIISEDAAKDGISKYFDFFERNTDTKRRTDLIIAKGIKAKNVLGIKSQLSKVPAIHSAESLELSKIFGKSFKIELIDVLKKLDNKCSCIILPIIHNNHKEMKIASQEDLIIDGAAVIKDDKLVGFLDPFQTRGLLFTGDKLKETLINISSHINPMEKISINLFHIKGKIIGKFENNKPILSIEIKSEGSIREQQVIKNLTKKDDILRIEKQVKDTLKKEIQNTIDITQKQYKSDIFGFINKIYKHDYKQWEKIVNKWDAIYSNTKINIDIEFKLRDTGLINKAAKLQ